MKNLKNKKEILLSGDNVSAGFPSPSEGYTEESLDLNEHLIQHPASTFFVRASGDSMIDAGIYSGDILIVDRSLTPVNGSIIIAMLNGEFTVKRFEQTEVLPVLRPENENFKSIEISEEDEFMVWGVVTSSIRSHIKRTKNNLFYSDNFKGSL